MVKLTGGKNIFPATKFNCMKIFISLCIICVSQTCISQNMMKILDKYISSKLQYNTLEYQVDYNYKPYGSDLPLSCKANVIQKKLAGDTIFGGYISIEMDSFWYGYDGTSVYRGQKKEDILEVADPHLFPGILIQNTWINNVIDYAFLRSYAGLKEDVFQHKEYIIAKDTLLNGEHCISILYNLPDHEAFTNNTIQFIISKNDYFMRKRILISNFQENQQIIELTYKNPKSYSSPVNPEFVHAFRNQFSETIFLVPQEVSEETIAKYPFNLLYGINLTDSSLINLVQLQDTVVVLDFWYSSCYPCIQSIPIVDRLAKEYEGKVRFFGVNPVDKISTDKARLQRFLRNNVMSYPTIMVETELRKDMPKISYPTIVILDKFGKIACIESGLDNLTYEGLKVQIEKQIK